GASELASEVVAKLKTANLRTDSAALTVAGYLLVDTFTPRDEKGGDEPPLLAPDVAADYTRYIFSLVLSLDTSSLTSQDLNGMRGLCQQVEAALDFIQRQSPETADALRKKIDEENAAISRLYGTPVYQNYDQASPDDILDQASNAPEPSRNNFYMLAA